MTRVQQRYCAGRRRIKRLNYRMGQGEVLTFPLQCGHIYAGHYIAPLIAQGFTVDYILGILGRRPHPPTFDHQVAARWLYYRIQRQV